MPPGWSSSTVPRILARDGHRCTYRMGTGRCPATTRLSVDHAGAPWDHRDVMLRTLCHEHHTRRTLAQSAASQWRYREKREPERHPGSTGEGRPSPGGRPSP